MVFCSVLMSCFKTKKNEVALFIEEETYSSSSSIKGTNWHGCLLPQLSSRHIVPLLAARKYTRAYASVKSCRAYVTPGGDAKTPPAAGYSYSGCASSPAVAC